MINLLCLLCSLCIQFVAVGIPYEMTYDDFTLGLMQTFEVQAQSSEDPRILFFADTWKTGEVQYFLFSGNNGNYEIWFDASKYNSSYTSSVVGRIEDNTNSYLQIELIFTRYYKIVFNPNYTSTLSCSFPNDYGWADYLYIRVYPYTQDSYKYLYMLNGVVNNSGGSPIIYGNYIFTEPVEPENPTLGFLGSLDSSGHSSGGNPLESMQNFTWGHHTSTSVQSGHNTHVSPNSATPDFTNAEQNLLGQIVDNTNSIIENTNNLGGALEVINGNIINGASAIFNAISQFNNNFVSTYVYDQDQVDVTLENSSMMLFASTTTDLTETIINESDVLLDAVHDMEEKQDLILYLDLTKWKVPVYSSSTGVNTTYVRPYNEVVQIDFTFLKETKSIWQPILLGVLYLALFMSIYFDLPNILRGANA